MYIHLFYNSIDIVNVRIMYTLIFRQVVLSEQFREWSGSTLITTNTVVLHTSTGGLV